MTTVVKYHLNDFQKIAEKNIEELDDDIISIINELASKVGAPNYNKTPIFKKYRTQTLIFTTFSIQIYS